MRDTTRRKFLIISGGVFTFGGLNRMFGDDIAEATGPDKELTLDADNITVDESRYSFGNYVFSDTKVEIKLSNEGNSEYSVFCHYSLVDSRGSIVGDLEGRVHEYIDGGSTVILEDYWGLGESEEKLISEVEVTEIVVEPSALLDDGRKDRSVINNE